MADSLRVERATRIDAYVKQYCSIDKIPAHLQEYEELQDLRRQILELFRKADQLAETIRNKAI
jgi:hypothetical protein